jgi:hypothetical protein
MRTPKDEHLIYVLITSFMLRVSRGKTLRGTLDVLLQAPKLKMLVMSKHTQCDRRIPIDGFTLGRMSSRPRGLTRPPLVLERQDEHLHTQATALW